MPAIAGGGKEDLGMSECVPQCLQEANVYTQ